MMKQGLKLSQRPHVVIATPGRLADHLKSTDTVSLKKIRFLVSTIIITQFTSSVLYQYDKLMITRNELASLAHSF